MSRRYYICCVIGYAVYQDHITLQNVGAHGASGYGVPVGNGQPEETKTYQKGDESAVLFQEIFQSVIS